MAQQINPPRGMRDFLPAEKSRRERALAMIRSAYRRHGFEEIETPVVEDAARLHSGLGGDNEKLAFGVLKRGLGAEELAAAAAEGDAQGLTDLGLRFDLTVPLARFYASNRAQLPGVFRSIQIAPVWRAERPQKGRFRQFVQCDIDIIGEPGILAETELMLATLDALAALGLRGATIRINDRRILTGLLEHWGFAAAEHAAVLITLDKLDKMGPDAVVAELREHGRSETAITALDAFLREQSTHPAQLTGPEQSTGFGEAQLRERLPKGFDSPALADLIELGRALAGVSTPNAAVASPAATATATASAHLAEPVIAVEAPLTFDPFLVRGMGYYTGTIYEIAHPDVPFSLGGGGRYDGMIGRFLGSEVPAVGFSLGFERIIDLLSDGALPGADRAVLLYDARVPAGDLLALKKQVLDAGASSVRLERTPKKVAPTLDRLAAEGVTRFAFVRPETAIAGLSALEFKLLKASTG